jgi:glycosyltransferase involved in cell wall biosynthesis
MILPKVSIIIPSYHQGNFIERTIKSVLNQTYRNIEIIVIDGGSNDNTLEVLSNYSNDIDYLVSEKDNGQGDAINKGIDISTGEFITWINSDDILCHDAIEIVIAEFKRDKSIDFIYGNVELINESDMHLGYILGSKILKPDVYFHHDINIPQQGSMWKKYIGEELLNVNTRWHYVLDRDFFLRISLIGKPLYIPKLLGKFRQHTNSKSVKLFQKWSEEMPSMYSQLFNDRNWIYDNNFNIKVLSSSYMHAAYIAILAKKYKRALNNIYIAIKLCPNILFNYHIYKKPINKFLKLIKK